MTESGDRPPDTNDDNDEEAGQEAEPAEPPRVEEVEEDELGPFQWAKRDENAALAVVLNGAPVKDNRVDVGSAGRFLNLVDTMTRILASHFGGLTPARTGTIAKPLGVGRLQLASAEGGASVTLVFAIDQPVQLSIDGGTDLFHTPMGRAVSELIELIASSTGEEEILRRVRELPGRAADRYHDLVELMVQDQLDVVWHPREGRGARMNASGAAEVKAILDREVAQEVATESFRGLLFEANARKNGFSMELDTGESIDGTYPVELEEIIRYAWNREVVAKIRVIRHRHLRSRNPFKIDRILLDVDAIPEDTGEPG